VTPVGLEDVSHYPEVGELRPARSLQVFAALIEDGTFAWTDEELGMVAGGNLITTFRLGLLLLPSFATHAYLSGPVDDLPPNRAVEEVRDIMAAEGVQADNSWWVINPSLRLIV
jgi:hypothetical protein